MRHIWEGYISEIRGDEFDVILTDLTDPKQPDEIFTFGLDRIREIDTKWVFEGSQLYFIINGPKVYFKFKKKYWKQEDIERAKIDAAEWEQKFMKWGMNNGL